MRDHFFQAGSAIRQVAPWLEPEVCPDAENSAETPREPGTRKPSDWARQDLGFTPSAKQAEILDLDARYLILCCNRQWGKTTAIALKALHRALNKPGESIVILSRTKQQAGIMIERAGQFAVQLGHKIRRVLGNAYSLKLSNGSVIFAVAHNTATSVGGTAHVLIVDEAALVKDEIYWTVYPYVARTQGAVWLLSTPQRQAGFFYNFWHDKDPRWHRILSTVKDCPEIDEQFLEMQRKANEIKYRQDFLCEFIQPANRLVSREFVRSILRDKPFEYKPATW